MTGYRSKHFRHDCSAEDCYVQQLPLWDDLIECFPRGIRPTDIDGMVEINGHFLFLEEKRQGAIPHDGQRMALKKLSRFHGVTVVFFRPKLAPVEVGTDMQVLVFVGGETSGWEDCSRAWFMEWLRDWVASAEVAS
jgi:hypothetical protein